jgi:putative ABC transport system permease protein
MILLTRLQSWLRNLLHRSRSERDMNEELHYHVEACAEDLIRTGVPREEALRRARLEFGGIEQAKERCRDARGLNLAESVFQDLHFGLFTLGKSPIFAVAAVLTIALGVGANAAIFGLMDSTVFSRIPFSDPERLLHIWTIEGADVHTPTPEQYQAIRDSNKSFEQVAAAGWTDYFYGEEGSVLQNLPGLLVTPNWLTTLGVRPLMGRSFRDDEQIAGQDVVVMLSYGCWHTRFHADPHIIGKRLVLNRRPVTVIGIVPQSLAPYYEDLDIFAPLVLDSYASLENIRAGKMRVEIFARLRPAFTLEQARTELDVIAARLGSRGGNADRPDRLVLEKITDAFQHPGPTMENALHGLGITGIAAGLLLLISCANVASMLLARGVKRRKEVALRAALGCSRGRMIRQFLTESVLLFLCGGAVAVIVTWYCETAITKLASGLIPGAYLHVNARVFALSLGISLVSAMAFGMIPAFQASRANPNEDLKISSQNVAGGSRSRRWRNALIGVQVALGMVLLVVFGLLMRSFWNVESSRIGYEPRQVLTATVRVPSTRYTAPSDRARLMRDAIERVRSRPEVEAVGIADSLPMQGADSATWRVEAPTPAVSPMEEEIWFVSVSPEYFSTLGVSMLAGRPFQQQDNGDLVAIVNQSFARKFFPESNPIGYHLSFLGSLTMKREIVGVVSDFRQRNPEEDLRPLVYLPIEQTLPQRWSMAIRLRAGTDNGNADARIGSWLRPLDPQLYWEMGSLHELILNSESVTMRRPMIELVASFGGLALLLVIVGVFGVTSFSVAERTREIGIRLALGASRRRIAATVLRESLKVALAGLGAGTLGAYLLALFLPTEGIGWSGSGVFLYGVSRMDSLTYFSAAALLIAVVLAASWGPARRATRVEPTIALRYE